MAGDPGSVERARATWGFVIKPQSQEVREQSPAPTGSGIGAVLLSLPLGEQGLRGAKSFTPGHTAVRQDARPG